MQADEDEEDSTAKHPRGGTKAGSSATQPLHIAQRQVVAAPKSYDPPAPLMPPMPEAELKSPPFDPGGRWKGADRGVVPVRSTVGDEAGGPEARDAEVAEESSVVVACLVSLEARCFLLFFYGGDVESLMRRACQGGGKGEGGAARMDRGGCPVFGLYLWMVWFVLGAHRLRR